MLGVGLNCSELTLMGLMSALGQKRTSGGRSGSVRFTPETGHPPAGHGMSMPHSNPRIDTLAVVISVGHKISVRPFATAIFCVPLTE